MLLYYDAGIKMGHIGRENGEWPVVYRFPCSCLDMIPSRANISSTAFPVSEDAPSCDFWVA